MTKDGKSSPGAADSSGGRMATELLTRGGGRGGGGALIFPLSRRFFLVWLPLAVGDALLRAEPPLAGSAGLRRRVRCASGEFAPVFLRLCLVIGDALGLNPSSEEPSEDDWPVMADPLRIVWTLLRFDTVPVDADVDAAAALLLMLGARRREAVDPKRSSQR